MNRVANVKDGSEIKVTLRIKENDGKGNDFLKLKLFYDDVQVFTAMRYKNRKISAGDAMKVAKPRFVDASLVGEGDGTEYSLLHFTFRNISMTADNGKVLKYSYDYANTFHKNVSLYVQGKRCTSFRYVEKLCNICLNSVHSCWTSGLRVEKTRSKL